MVKKVRRKDGVGVALSDFSNAVSEILNEIITETYEDIDRGLDKAMDLMRDKLSDASPVDSGLTRDTWEGENKYKNVRYINNTRLNEQGIPVVNLLEFGSKGKPFVRKTVAENQDEIINIIKGEIENGRNG